MFLSATMTEHAPRSGHAHNLPDNECQNQERTLEQKKLSWR